MSLPAFDCASIHLPCPARRSISDHPTQLPTAPALLPYLQIPSNDDQQLTLTGRPIRRQPVQHPGIASVATPSGARLSPAATLYIQTLPDHPASARLSLPSFQLPVQPRRAYIPCERCDVTPVVIHTNHDSVPLLAITPARRAT